MQVVFGTAEDSDATPLVEHVSVGAVEVGSSSSSGKIKRTATVALTAQSFSGPMPPPEHLAQYDRIVPGAARLIVDEFQLNARHARDVERMGLRGSIGRDRRAQVIAGLLVLIGFGLIYGLAEHGHDGVAISVAVTLLVSVLTAFLTGTVVHRRDEDDVAIEA
jgi:uncharacterized membrane protein